MRILLLTHRLPYPLESGQNLRLYHLAGRLAARNELDLIAYGVPPYDRQLRQVFREIRTVPVPRIVPPPVSLRRVVRAFDVDDLFCRDPAMDAMVRDAVARGRPDVVWVGGWDMLVYATALAGVPVVADAMDEGFLECSRELRRARGPRAFVQSLKRLVNHIRWERRYFRRVACCVFVSDVDARWARRVVPGLRVCVVENGVDGEFFHPLGTAEEFPSLVFEGNQSFPPNVDAVRYFIERVFPPVRARFPACRFYVVGRDPAPASRRLAGEGVIVTGRVDDVRPYLDRATVFVCPMRTGAGIKNKILQAWAMARPVVATPAAVGGLRAQPGQNILIAGTPAAFAEHLTQLFGDPIYRRELGKQGRDTVLAHYTWEQQARALEEILRSA